MARDVRRQPFDRRQTLRTTAPHLLAPSGIMKYDIQTLKVFVTVSQEGSIAKAAAKEHTVASAVSKRISELEKSIGRSEERVEGKSGSVRVNIGGCGTVKKKKRKK